MSQPHKFEQEIVQHAWDTAYSSAVPTNWELLPLDDLSVFWDRYLQGENIQSVVDIGCGRALRAMFLLLSNKHLNSSGFSYTGVDISPRAIASALDLAEDLRREPDARRTELAARVSSTASFPLPPLEALTTFVQGDGTAALEHYAHSLDVVIDWMSFHELPAPSRAAYVAALKQSTAKWLLLKVFSLEDSSLLELTEAVPGVPKHRFSQHQIAALFAPDFEIAAVEDYPELFEAEPPHSDGAVAAKRAYLLCRKPHPTSVRT